MFFWTIEMSCTVSVSTFPSQFALEGAFCNFEIKNNNFHDRNEKDNKIYSVMLILISITF